jgi:hypothetical protein
MTRKSRMTKQSKIISLAIALMVIMAILFPLRQEARSASCDTTAPLIDITSPTNTGLYETDKATLDLSGNVSDDAGVKKIVWTITNGNWGPATAIINGLDPLLWSAKSLPLSPGVNLITVKATDAAGNEGQDTMVVNYVVPPVIPTTLERELLNIKTKFTFYFNDPTYWNIDRFSVVANLKNKTSDTFVLPHHQNVNIKITMQDPDNALIQHEVFKTTIPADSEFVSGTTKYLYRNSGSGIQELQLYRLTATTSYLYVFVDKIEMMRELKSAMAPAAYQGFVSRIKSYTMTVQFGEFNFTGTASLSPGTPGDKKQELVFNR